ncbi:MAG: gamma-glutamyl-gamma-aminobutyrate hydrolase family protein [Alphaproteobacteria bacterium]|nr:MAG: gamma-glutamyl-gamma-aminobutyrate hydrolase family protein [Alphaproteobacteria bacterium]
MKTPIIGISLDIETNPTYSRYPWYALRENYTTSFITAGGTTVALPHDIAAVPHYLDILSGIVVTGGAFDVNPELYGEPLTPAIQARLKPLRTNFEMALLEGALKRDMPILGICGGEQILNVVLGGSLIQHIPDQVPDALEHLQNYDAAHTAHKIHIAPNTLLHRLVGQTTIDVNTSHHQAVKGVSNHTIISARAPDGIIEAIEYPSHPFCLGVQWHPEFHATPYDKHIIAGFVAATRVYAGNQ